MPKRLFVLMGGMVLLVLSNPCDSGAELYKWVDEKGAIHFSDNPGAIPPRYRDRVESRNSPSERMSGNGEERGPSGDGGEAASGGTGTVPGRFEVGYIAQGSGGEGRVIIPVTFNGVVTARLAVDTGAPGLVIFKGLAERLGLFQKAEGKIPVVAGGIGGNTPAVRTIIDSVRVGGATDSFVPTTVLMTSLSDSFEGLVGMDFMSRYAMQIDPVRRKVVFQELAGSSGNPGGHDEIWWRRNFREFAEMKQRWRDYRDELNRFSAEFKGSPEQKAKIEELQKAAYGWYREASKMYDRLTWYATDSGVPLHWRD